MAGLYLGSPHAPEKTDTLQVERRNPAHCYANAAYRLVVTPSSRASMLVAGLLKSKTSGTMACVLVVDGQMKTGISQLTAVWFAQVRSGEGPIDRFENRRCSNSPRIAKRRQVESGTRHAVLRLRRGMIRYRGDSGLAGLRHVHGDTCDLSHIVLARGSTQGFTGRLQRGESSRSVRR